MSAEQLELRELNRAFNSGGDWPSFYAADAELHMPARLARRPGLLRASTACTRRSSAWRGGFDEYHWREERLIDAGDDRVVGLYYHRGRDQGGRRWIDQAIGCVFTFAGEKIARLDGFFSWPEAHRRRGRRRPRGVAQARSNSSTWRASM